MIRRKTLKQMNYFAILKSNQNIFKVIEPIKTSKGKHQRESMNIYLQPQNNLTVNKRFFKCD